MLLSGKTRWVLLSAICAGVVASSQSRPVPGYADNLPFDHPAINYQHRLVHDSVSRLQATNTRWKVAANSQAARLANVLELLGVNPDSQVLVFSKTSFQSALISPRNPRAVYFNDEVAVGFVRGSPIVEVTALDRAGGNEFYTLNLQADTPAFQRQETCLSCHQGVATQGVPGIFIGSVYPASNGHAASQGAIITDHRTAFRDRWGGWYVNAGSGEPLSRANASAVNPVAETVLDVSGPRNRISMFGAFNTKGYLSDSSDIIALMTLEHQTQATNLITRLSWLSKLADAPGASLSVQQAEDSAVEDLLRFLLFSEEAPFNPPIVGASGFARRFPAQGPRDRKGRSLRDFDLRSRLFRYPLSYMVYSPAFDALPNRVRGEFALQLKRVLNGESEMKWAGQTSTKLRADVLQIVKDTKPELFSLTHSP
jgi:hypothetical protein